MARNCIHFPIQLSEGPTKPELIPTSIQLSKINLALEASSKQNNLNGGELVRKTKDEIMEESVSFLLLVASEVNIFFYLNRFIAIFIFYSPVFTYF